MSLSAGDRLGPYEILGALGSGGMGAVYRANDSRLKREVAVKVAGAQFTERAAREARLAASLNHPHICHIYDVGANYLVMELVEGPTLSERLKRGRIPIDEALGIARQIAEAMEAAHEKGIVHRDLKPANVKIRHDGTVKVLDFGLAKATEENVPEGDPEHSPTITLKESTRTGVVVGTAGYMSPEQARGKAVDKRADIWAFGVVLYEMLTGQRLFQGDTVSDTLAAVLTHEPEWDRVPAVAERMLRRCLEKDPKQRLRDIGDALFLLDNDSQKAAPPSKSSLQWIIGAAATLAVAGGALVLLWQASHQAAPSILRLSVNLGEDAALEPNRANAMTISPDGSRLVFIVGQALTNTHLALRRLDQDRATAMPGTEGAEAPFFSPDGKSIAFFAEGKLKKSDTAGGSLVSLCDAPSPREGGWGDDDNIVFAATNRGGLSRVSATGGTPQPITRLEGSEYSHRYPQVLPGSRAVVFTNSPDETGEGRIEVLNLQTGKRKVLVQAGGYGHYLPGGFLTYMHRGTLFAVPMDLGRLELNGTPAPVLEDVAFHPSTGCAAYAFSQSGMFVYVAASADDKMRPIGLIDDKGKMDLLPVAKAKYSHPRISPDGKRLAVTIATASGAHVWIYGWENQRLSRLASQASNTRHAVWSPDGRFLVFFSDSPIPGPGIYGMRADGVGVVVRLVEGKDLVPQVFFARAARLLYEVQGGPKAGLWSVTLDWSHAEGPTGGVPELIPGPELGGPAGFSSDGRWLAYEGGAQGTPEVMVRPFPGAGGPWQLSTGGTSPFWSNTGGDLFYRSVPDSRVMVVSYSAAGDSFLPGRPRIWSDVRVDSLDVMPDGKRVVVIPAALQKEPTHATFLLNFGEELRRRVK
jgi:serine/threonine-protein kinase